MLPFSTISVISPPLAPNSPAPVSHSHLVCVFRNLLSSSSQANQAVTFFGDSSGGNLTLSLTISALQDSNVPAPQSIFLLCPSVDLRHKNPAARALQPKDPILRHRKEVKTSKDWAGEWTVDATQVSPLLADLTVLEEQKVKVHGVTAGYDILTPDALILRERLAKMGVEGRWLDWDKQMHCFPLAFSYGLPESVRGLEWIVDVLSQDGAESSAALT